MNRKHLLYVENISPSSTEEHLIAYLEKWAPVQQVYFLREKQCTKRSIAAFVRVANEADLELLLLMNQQKYRGKRLFMVRVDQTLYFQADTAVIVRNITGKISEENLYDHFEDCGKIAFLQIRTDDFAYIGFEDKSSVRNAMNKNNIPLKGSNLKIQLLTRNVEIMIVNLDTLQSRMPDLYRKMILPVEPRQPGVAPQQQLQPQKPGNQPQNSQPAKQQAANQQQQSQTPKQQQQYQPRQQTGNQQQQQQQRGQPPQQKQTPQQPPKPQRQQQKQPEPQQQQMSVVQLLMEKANAFSGKQQQSQQKPQQQTPAVQPAKPTPPVQEPPKKKQAAVTSVPAPVPAPTPVGAPKATAVQPMETTDILDDESDEEIPLVDPSVVPPIPSAYKPQPGDIMRPVKASEIAMSVVKVKNDKDSRSVWINNIPPETRRLTLVMYMEQFGDVESCKISSSSNCYFNRWAKVCFTSEEAAKRATEYFLHPFQGRYLFVLACNRCVEEAPGKVFVLDYLSKYLVYEDVAKSFKPVGEVFYLVRQLDNSSKVRIFFLDKVDANATVGVKSIGGKPITVEPYTGMDLKLPKDLREKLKQEREVMDRKKEARLARILEIYKQEQLDRCDPVINPEGKSEGNIALMSNVHSSTTEEQIKEFLKSIGDPTSIHREKELYNEGFERVYVGFRTLSMVLKATELPADKTLNGYKPFIFAAWTKPHMTEWNTERYSFDSPEITVQDVYNGFIQSGKIRYVMKEKTKRVLIVWDGHDNGINNCKITTGSKVGPASVESKTKYIEILSNSEKQKGFFNIECMQMLKDKNSKFATPQEKQVMHSTAALNKKQVMEQENLITQLELLLRNARAKRGEEVPPAKVEQIDDKNVQLSNKQQKLLERRDKFRNQRQQDRRGPPQQQQRSGRDRNRSPFAGGNSSRQRHHPYQQQQDQRRSMNPWAEQDNQGPIWDNQQQQFLRQPDDRFNRNNDGPFDMFDQGGRNMHLLEQMLQFENCLMNQQNDNGFNCGPMDTDDPPLDRARGHQQQHFNQFSPQLNFGPDSPGIPPNIPEDEIDVYIMRKQEAIQRRLEQLDQQLGTSVDSSPNRDFGQAQRRRKGPVFSDNGDVNYVRNPADVARNRDRRGFGGGRSRGSGGGRRGLMNRF